MERTAKRIRKVHVEVDRLVDTPYGVRPDIHPGIRFLRRDKAAIWFLPVEHSRAIVVAAIFYGAQDHIRNARTYAGGLRFYSPEALLRLTLNRSRRRW